MWNYEFLGNMWGLPFKMIGVLLHLPKLELPFKMTPYFPKLDLKSLLFAENLKSELLGGIIALFVVALTYIHYRMKKPKGAAAQSLYPLHRTKIVHLVRHAQGVHNVAAEKNHDACMSYDFFDAHLSPLGWEQVNNLRKHVKACELSKTVELVVVSPLLRTIQTAVGVFGGEAYTDGISEPPLMMENVGHSDLPAVSSLNCPPFIAVELCREQIGLHPCDKRRTVSEYRNMFPAIDFSLIESDEDILWESDVREKTDEVSARGLKFLEWLWTRKEKEIAVVTHSNFLSNTLRDFGNDCHPSIKSEICTRFTNCELRSVVIIDGGMIGSSESTTNYPGKIPFRGIN